MPAPTTAPRTPTPPTTGPAMANNKNSKDALMDPPPKIRNPNNGVVYTRMAYLGEGGFARVWSFLGPDGRIHAAKTVPLATIKSASKKTKLYIEIKVHQLFHHPNICRFDDVFQDSENVYIMLEICGGGNMMDLLKRRKRYTEPEARYFMVQIVSAVSYMHHSANVMHRDLKLGNIFLDDGMNVKLGDFGLAAVVENEGDRRRTMCGTPNYIAPEVITKKGKGHSYECDIWGIGVILYTMLVGKPPFQCSSVNDIYKKIKNLDYTFPEKVPISLESKDLIRSILTTDPKLRPTLSEILSHDWFQAGPFPARLSKSTVEQPVDWSHVSDEQSRANFLNAKARAKYDLHLPINLPKPSVDKFKSALEARAALGGAIAAQEREFETAIHPDSPIAALLLSARKPPVVAPANMPREPPPVMGRLQTATNTRSPLRREIKSTTSRARQVGKAAEQHQDETLDEIEEEEDDQRTARRPVKQQRQEEEDQRTARLPTKQQRQASSTVPSNVLSPAGGRKVNAGRPGDGVHVAHSRKVSRVRAEVKSPMKKPASAAGGADLYLRVCKNLGDALGAKSQDEEFRHPNMPLRAQPPKIFISCWLDYVQKYGMGFALTDGSIGVLFNDSTAMIASPDAQTMDHLVPVSKGVEPLDSFGYRRDEHAMADVKSEPSMKDRVYLLGHFREYIQVKLYGEHSYNFQGDIDHGMVYLQRYWRFRNVVAFRLSNDILQMNYSDHTKLIISRDGLVITYIDSNYEAWTWSLADLVHCRPSGDSGRERRRLAAALRRTEYAATVISKLDKVPYNHGVAPAASARKMEVRA